MFEKHIILQTTMIKHVGKGAAQIRFWAGAACHEFDGGMYVKIIE